MAHNFQVIVMMWRRPELFPIQCVKGALLPIGLTGTGRRRIKEVAFLSKLWDMRVAGGLEKIFGYIYIYVIIYI